MKRSFRLMPVLFAAALASCEAGGPSGDGLPPLREGFTYLTRVGGVIRNASMEGFNTDAVGLAISGDGSRVAALVMAGQFFQTFTTTTVYDWASGSYVSELGGGTSTNTWFTLHLSDDGGATWRELAVRPAHDAPTGWTSGLVLAGERLFTTVEGPSGRQVVEIDTDTGVYQAIDVRYPDGGRWAPSLYQSRAFGSRIVSVEVPLDAGYVAAWRGDLATGEAHVYRDDAPACIPRGVLVGGPRPELFVATSADRVQGICTTFDDRVCSFVWDLRDDAPFTTPLEIRRCAPAGEFARPSSLAMDGVVPEVIPIAVLPTRGGLHVVGRAEYVSEGAERVWSRAVALAFREDGGPPDAVDLGPGDIAVNDPRSLHPQRGGLAMVVPDCGERSTDGTTGACIGEGGGDGFDAPTLVGWDPSASGFGAVALSPSACVDPAACFAVPNRLLAAGAPRASAAGPLVMRVEGEPGRLGDRSAFELVVEGRGGVGAPVVEIALPGAAHFDAEAMESLRRSGSVRSVAAPDRAGVVRVRLAPLAEGAAHRVPLPWRWIASGRTRGLGVTGYDASRPWETSVIEPRELDVEAER